jgi:hypothetical protein
MRREEPLRRVSAFVYTPVVSLDTFVSFFLQLRHDCQRQRPAVGVVLCSPKYQREQSMRQRQHAIVEESQRLVDHARATVQHARETVTHALRSIDRTKRLCEEMERRRGKLRPRAKED